MIMNILKINVYYYQNQKKNKEYLFNVNELIALKLYTDCDLLQSYLRKACWINNKK